METKQISAVEFTKDVNAGMKRKQLVEKYSLPLANINAIAKQLKLEIKRDLKPKFELVFDVPVTNQLVTESLNA